METHKVDMFMMSHGSDFPENKALFIRERLTAADDSKWGILSSMQFKNPLTSLILSLLLGEFGVDRFYIGSTGCGVGKLLTCGGFGLWTFIDWFLIMGATREKNYEKLVTVL